jgi:hypothetical protein
MKYLILAVALAVSAGCVYSPIYIDVASNTEATLSGSTVSIDAHKAVPK